MTDDDSAQQQYEVSLRGFCHITLTAPTEEEAVEEATQSTPPMWEVDD